MGIQSEVIARGLIELQAQGVAEAEKQLEGLGARIGDLDKWLKQGAVSLDEYTAEITPLLSRYAILEQAILKAEAAMSGASQAAGALTENLGGMNPDILGRALSQVPGVANKVGDEMTRLSNQMMDFDDMLRKDAISITEYQSAMKGLTAQYSSLERAVKVAEKIEEVQEKTGTATKRSTEEYYKNQRAIMASRAAQDFMAAGLNGVINNIEQLTMAFGKGSPGAEKWAGYLTFAALGIQAAMPLIQHFAQIIWDAVKPVDELTGSLESLEKRSKELREKPFRLSFETRELEEAEGRLKLLKDGLEAFNQSLKSKSHYEKESGSAVSEALANADGGEAALTQTMKGQRVAELKARSTDYNDWKRVRDQKVQDVKDMESDMSAPPENSQAARIGADRAEEKMAQIEAKIKTEAEAEIGDMIKRAKEGDRLGRNDLAHRLEQAGQGRRASVDINGNKTEGEGLAHGIDLSSPEELETLDAVEDAEVKRQEEMKATRLNNKDVARQRKEHTRKKAGEFIEKAAGEDSKAIEWGAAQLKSIREHSGATYRGKHVNAHTAEERFELFKKLATDYLNEQFKDETQGDNRVRTEYAKEQISGAATQVFQRSTQAIEEEKKKAENAKKTDAEARKEIEKGLGDTFIAQAQMRILEFNANISRLTPQQQRAARIQFEQMIRTAAAKQLARTHTAAEAEQMSQGALPFLVSDIHEQEAKARIAGERARPTQAVYAQLQRNLIESGNYQDSALPGRGGQNKGKSKPPPVEIVAPPPKVHHKPAPAEQLKLDKADKPIDTAPPPMAEPPKPPPAAPAIPALDFAPKPQAALTPEDIGARLASSDAAIANGRDRPLSPETRAKVDSARANIDQGAVAQITNVQGNLITAMGNLASAVRSQMATLEAQGGQAKALVTMTTPLSRPGMPRTWGGIAPA